METASIAGNRHGLGLGIRRTAGDKASFEYEPSSHELEKSGGSAPSAWGSISTTRSSSSYSKRSVEDGEKGSAMYYHSSWNIPRQQRTRILLALFILFFSTWLLLVYLFYVSNLNTLGGPKAGFGPHSSVATTPLSTLEAAAAKAAATKTEGRPFIKRRIQFTPSLLAENPDLTVPVLLPIEVRSLKGTTDMELDMCQLDFAPYHRNPSRYPKSSDLVKNFCSQRQAKSQRLVSEFAADTSVGKQLRPTAFIFHESRVGSTLVSNMLASVPANLVYSEPHVPADVIKQCEARTDCTETDLINLLRLAILAMGRSSHHDNFFIKFQSAMTPYIELFTKAFPETPWIYVYRDPVEVMVSNLQDGKGHGACVRHKDQAPQKVLEILGVSDGLAVSDEDYCAAHLAMLRDTALENLQKADSKGRAVAYETLVTDVMDVILPGHFGVVTTTEEYTQMRKTSTMYSKARNANMQKSLFAGDTLTKQKAASQAVKEAASLFLKNSNTLLEQVSRNSHQELQDQAAFRSQQEGWVYERTGSRFFELPSCPDTPSLPASAPILNILENWDLEDTSIPSRHYSTLCRIDFIKEYDKAMRYRAAEVPFIVTNVPQVDTTVKKWNTAGYLLEKLGKDQKYRVEVSEDNHFLYFAERFITPEMTDYKPPTTLQMWTYDHWLTEAYKAVGGNRHNVTAQEHYYFRVSSGDNPVVDEDLPIFDVKKPTASELFVIDPRNTKGIHCRFGMPDIVAQAHYDGKRNMVASLAGTRRWILAHPRECKHAYLRPAGHPSGRHSEVDWSQPDLKKYPEFANMRANEVLLTPGEVLYVPSYWLHSIQSLDVNIQCNMRSGRSHVALEDVQACGFHMGE